jgi:hypothetical protein
MAEPVAYIEPSKASPNADAIFVSPTGDDSAAGTETAPLKTIQAGFDKAAAAKSTSLVLRGGTYYLTSAVNVNSKHSGIAVTAYNDEEPVISGGKELTTEWKPYDVSNGTASWTTKVFFTSSNLDLTSLHLINPNLQVGDNIVWSTVADGKTIIDLGKNFTDAASCEAACKQHSDCTGYTWHDSQQGGYSHLCRIRTDGLHADHMQSGHTSGWNMNDHKNIYVADVTG